MNRWTIRSVIGPKQRARRTAFLVNLVRAQAQLDQLSQIVQVGPLQELMSKCRCLTAYALQAAQRRWITEPRPDTCGAFLAAAADLGRAISQVVLFATSVVDNYQGESDHKAELIIKIGHCEELKGRSQDLLR